MTRHRHGFTLIELMIVILIIAILMALLIPATIAVINRSRVAAAKSEIASIGTGLADFEAEFGELPPSFITFDLTNTAADARPGSFSETRAVLRSMFPQINLNTDPGKGPTPIITDLTAAGLWGAELHGPEALVFFLGGIRRNEDTNGNGTLDPGEDTDGDGTLNMTNELTGFSKNPARPFLADTAATSTRVGPFTELDPDRLVDTDGDGALEYLDNFPGQTSPIIYVSTARTNSYVATDSGSTWVPYKKTGGTFHNPETYQLVSPGQDMLAGAGGVIPEEGATGEDADNITNFSEGPLGG